MKRAVVLAIAACSHRHPITSCDDDLRGVYAAGDERWMVLDDGATLEVYPLFPDTVAPGTAPPRPQAEAVTGTPTPAEVPVRASAPLEIAPRVIDLERTAAGAGSPEAAAPGRDRDAPSGGTALAGTLRRRYMQRAEACEAHVAVHVTRCAGDTLELVLADPSPPTGFAPCTWPRPAQSRVVRWRRE